MIKKKILVITPRFPYPVIGGDRLRIYELCKELSKHYSITLLSLCESKKEMQYHVPNDGVFVEVRRHYLPKWRSYLNCLLALPTKTPLQVAYYKSRSFHRLVDCLSEHHDLILPHLIRTAEYAKDLKQKKIVEMTDAISMNYLRVSQVKNSSGLKGVIYRLERNRLNRYEKEITKYFDYSVFVSKIDKEFLFSDNERLLSKALVCSNGVDLTKLPYQFSPTKKKLVFIGNMYSAQNFDAAYWFAKEVLPEVRRYGDYQFHVIGKIKPDCHKKLAKIEGVVVTGSVENVVDHTQGAIAGICSVRLGAGVQNKILEYMALGIPTISSSTGLEGLFAVNGKDILIADSVEDYVRYVLKLENDIAFAENISECAYEYVQEQHSWSGKLKPLLNKVHQLIH
ncbi:glycosyltransferase [Vibrio parahaemolyticus]|nr:glycosyltransferase [Vibrio parahaemolyticus]